MKASPLNLSLIDRTRMTLMQRTRLRERLGEEVGFFVDFSDKCHLFCSSPAQVDRLTADPLNLQRQIYLIFGVDEVCLWFAQEMVWSSDSLLNESQNQELTFTDELELIQFSPESEESSMTTATIDRIADAVAGILPGVVAGAIEQEDATQQESERINDLVTEFLTSDRFLEMLRDEIRSQRNGNGNGNTAAPTTAEEPEIKPKRSYNRRKEAAKRTTTRRKPKA